MTPPGVSVTAVPCSCVGGCGAVIVADCEPFGEQPHEAYIEFSLAFHASPRYRLRAAWRVLRARDPWLHSIALEGEGIARMREAFSVSEATP